MNAKSHITTFKWRHINAFPVHLSSNNSLEQCAVHAHEIVFFSREAWTVLPWRAFWIGAAFWISVSKRWFCLRKISMNAALACQKPKLQGWCVSGHHQQLQELSSQGRWICLLSLYIWLPHLWWCFSYHLILLYILTCWFSCPIFYRPVPVYLWLFGDDRRHDLGVWCRLHIWCCLDALWPIWIPLSRFRTSFMIEVYREQFLWVAPPGL